VRAHAGAITCRYVLIIMKGFLQNKS